ncbi:MAG: prepilin-type N-terminal cleavage/methylation domain-containing protein [Pseudomonadota bacterium]
MTASRRGFTLVEVLVALLIMAVIAAMGWQGVAGMVRARDIGEAASDRTLRLSTVIGQWEQDLGAIYDSPLVPGISFDGAALRLVRRSDNGVQLVVWAVRDGVWQRWPGPVVRRSAELREAWLGSQQLQGQEPGQLTLLDGVTGWQLYFWRGQGWSNAQSSGDEVTVTETVPAPAAPASGASAPAEGASAPAAAASAPTVTTRSRTLLPTGVRLQLDLPEGRIHRDVMLSPTS